MDYCSLLALFRRLIVAGPLLLGAGDVACTGGCPRNTTTSTFPVPLGAGYGTDASVDALLARCQASSSDCIPLCDRVAPSPESITSCGLVTNDGGFAILVVYTWTACG